MTKENLIDELPDSFENLSSLQAPLRMAYSYWLWVGDTIGVGKIYSDMDNEIKLGLIGMYLYCP